MLKTIFTVTFLVFFIFYGMAQDTNRLVIHPDIYLMPLGDSVYVHETWHAGEPYGRFPSNGLIIIREGQAVMIDTPWDNEKTRLLTEYLQDSMQVKLTLLIIGHFHNDCMGGLGYIHEQDIESIANTMTVDKCRQLGKPVPRRSFTDSLILDFNGTPLHCRFFGGGHTEDNIVVWLPPQRLLFGGCLIRSLHSSSLGNLSDAVPQTWDNTVERIVAAYPDVQTVIPGHGAFGGPELLFHTLERVKEHKSQNHNE